VGFTGKIIDNGDSGYGVDVKVFPTWAGRNAMSLRTRLNRLEQKAADAARVEPEQPDLFERIRQHLAYERGEGPRPPDPPCPRWFKPAEWEKRMRIGRCGEDRFAGRLGDNEYLPGMDDEEKRLVDGYCVAIRKAAEHESPATRAFLASLCEPPRVPL